MKEHCALIVDRGLGQVNGVTEHRVELNNRRAVHQSGKNKEVVKEAIKKIKDMGYGVSTVKGTFPVLGMTCASCASSAQTIAQGTAG
jgi:Cu2+-exporting ATPase